MRTRTRAPLASGLSLRSTHLMSGPTSRRKKSFSKDSRLSEDSSIKGSLEEQTKICGVGEECETSWFLFWFSPCLAMCSCLFWGGGVDHRVTFCSVQKIRRQKQNSRTSFVSLVEREKWGLRVRTWAKRGSGDETLLRTDAGRLLCPGNCSFGNKRRFKVTNQWHSGSPSAS